MRSEVSLQIASLLEGLRAADERTDKVAFQICLKSMRLQGSTYKGRLAEFKINIGTF